MLKCQIFPYLKQRLSSVKKKKIFLIKKKESVLIWQLTEEGDTIVSNQLDGKQPAKMCRAFPE